MSNQNTPIKLRKAEACKSMDEIREQIDLIDQELIRLFAARSTYVSEIVKFKDKTEEAIIAHERKAFVIEQRSEWAESFGLDKAAYAKLFEQLIETNISKELEILNTINSTE